MIGAVKGRSALIGVLALTANYTNAIEDLNALKAQIRQSADSAKYLREATIELLQQEQRTLSTRAAIEDAVLGESIGEQKMEIARNMFRDVYPLIDAKDRKACEEEKENCC